jgi:hypothetical protein
VVQNKEFVISLIIRGEYEYFSAQLGKIDPNMKSALDNTKSNAVKDKDLVKVLLTEAQYKQFCNAKYNDGEDILTVFEKNQLLLTVFQVVKDEDFVNILITSGEYQSFYANLLSQLYNTAKEIQSVLEETRLSIGHSEVVLNDPEFVKKLIYNNQYNKFYKTQSLTSHEKLFLIRTTLRVVKDQEEFVGKLVDDDKYNAFIEELEAVIKGLNQLVNKPLDDIKSLKSIKETLAATVASLPKKEKGKEVKVVE